MRYSTEIVEYRYDVVRKGDRRVIFSFGSDVDARQAVQRLVERGSKESYHIEAVNTKA